MTKNLLFSAIAVLTFLTSCGPAAEDRQFMHERAKVFQDSIATFIRTSMAEAEAPGHAVYVDTAAARRNAQAAATATKK